MEIHRHLHDCKWQAEPPLDSADKIKINDYLGLFEICEYMIQRKIIDEKMFRGLYEYRLYNFKSNKALAINKLVLEHADWSKLYELLHRLYGANWLALQKFIQGIQAGHPDLEFHSITEHQFRTMLDEKSLKRYDELLTLLGLK